MRFVISQSYSFAYHAALPRQQAGACSKDPCRVLSQTQISLQDPHESEGKERESPPLVSVLLMKSYLTDSDSV